MKILLIDNGTKLLHKLQELIPGHEITIKWRDIKLSDTDNFDVIILSGSSTSSIILNHSDFKNEIKLIKETKTPVIGICFGCELIVYSFGGKLKELDIPHEGIKEIEIITSNLSDKEVLRVYEHHKYIIDKMPDNFIITAKSKDGPEAIQHNILPIYGLQFHPENFIDETDGKDIFDNLFRKVLIEK